MLIDATEAPNEAKVYIEQTDPLTAKVIIVVGGKTKFEDVVVFRSTEALRSFMSTFLDMPNPPATAIVGVTLSMCNSFIK